MARPTSAPVAKELQRVTRSALERLLQLRVTHDLVDHVVDEKRRDWREFVEELHYQQYPIRGIGVIATPHSLDSSDVDAERGGFLHANEDVAPDSIVSNLNDYPLEAASAAYAFSVIETYGNDIANLLRPGSVPDLATWHRDIRFDLERADGEQGVRAMAAFAKPFGADYLAVKPASVIRLVAIRKARNDYVHRRDTDIHFERFLAFSLAVVCQIYFLSRRTRGSSRSSPGRRTTKSGRDDRLRPTLDGA